MAQCVCSKAALSSSYDDYDISAWSGLADCLGPANLQAQLSHPGWPGPRGRLGFAEDGRLSEAQFLETKNHNEETYAKYRSCILHAFFESVRQGPNIPNMLKH